MDNARSVEELYTAHARLVRSVCRSLLRDREEAEDAMQQTFLSAQRALANGSEPREPAAWLATIARNECLARVRERMREPLPTDAEPSELGADAYTMAASRYEVATLRDALADLPRAQREAILLRELRGMSYDEVARALSLTTGAVESLIFRARRTLQVRLREALPAFSPIAFLGRVLGGGGDVTVPVVAKVAAVGVGATLLAGGAALGPRALGLGHAATKQHRSPPAAHVQTVPPGWAQPSFAHVAAQPMDHETTAGETETVSSTDVAERSTPETEHENERETTTPVATPTPTAQPSRADSADSPQSGDKSDDPSGTDN